MKKGTKSEVQKIEIRHDQLPIIIVFKGHKGEKEYVLKTNKDLTKLLLNKKEY